MNNTDGYISVCVRISGRVQGVGFRFWTREQALRLGIKGHVFNKPDGSVDAVFCGRRDTVEEMIWLCSKGSIYSRVDDLTVLSKEPVLLCPECFRILR